MGFRVKKGHRKGRSGLQESNSTKFFPSLQINLDSQGLESRVKGYVEGEWFSG